MHQRIISLLPSAAEIICLVGGQPELVARSHEDDFPSTIQHLPILTEAKTKFTTSADVDRQVTEALSQGTSLYNLDVDQLKALQPSVIVTQDLCNVCSIDLVSVQRVASKMDPQPEIVTLNPTSEAAKVRANLEGRIQKCKDVAAQAKKDNPDYKPKKVMFFEWTDPIYPAGHWTPEMIEMAGGVHPINRPGIPSVRVSVESVVAVDPDVLIICPCGLDMAATRKEYEILMEKEWFRDLANKATTVALVDGNQMFNRSGPRLVECTEWLVMLLHDRPDFEPVDFPWERIK
ncbi:helical backbone metal receptor [Linnemannia elongata AG-77]|uniref:Helical backbone metal receptor n=1 Tax=Linnemannia elongata AG-77 TaxID=1314771 RepID=A0A197KBU2_9FUNG|nr:helical backbone metal receptor [Linnemannia elongata AG-77]